MHRAKQIARGCAAILPGVNLAVAGAHKPKQIGQYSGFEGDQEAPGVVVAAAIQKAGGVDNPRYDFSGQELEVGLAVSEMIRTLNSNSAYPHEKNDALLKMTLEYVQFAKNEGRLEAVARQDDGMVTIYIPT